MHCLRWWLPIFLLPLPAASPYLLILFIISYAIRTKPCAYCSVIIIGLMFSTCSLYQFTSLSNLLATPSFSAKLPIPQDTLSSILGTPSPSSTAGETMSTTSATAQSHSPTKQSSSCWIDLTHRRPNETSSLMLGRWSSPTWRKFPSVLRQAKGEEAAASAQVFSEEKSAWQKLLDTGIFIGFDNVGFQLKLGID